MRTFAPMYGQQSIHDYLFLILYGGVAMLALAAGFYLWLRRSNAIAPTITPPTALRRWTAAFFFTVALSHVWWFVLGVYWLTDDRLVRNITAVTLDHILLVPLVMAMLLRMLQDRKRRLWPWFLTQVPIIVAAAIGIVRHDEFYGFDVTTYWQLAVMIVFVVYYVYSLVKYGRWLRENFADLEHKEVWQSLLFVVAIFAIYEVYFTNPGEMTREYLGQVNTIVIIAFLLWRVETLQTLDPSTAEPVTLETVTEENEEAPKGINIGVLLERHCEGKRLYLQHDLTLQQLAIAVGTNRTYLSSYFAQQGITYNVYINRLRIEHFIRLYREATVSSRPITAIQLAQQSGFYSYSTFSAAFKKFMGVTVSEWMKKSMIMVSVGVMLMGFVACGGQQWSEQQVDSFMLVTQKGGPSLGYAPQSGVKILTVDGYAFKDLNHNDSLDAYEDWRLSPQERAADLASQLSVEEIAGLMLYSSHQAVPADSLTSDQKKFLHDDHLRAVLITTMASPETAAKWNNNMQAFVEGLDHGIPANTSSDPRHEAKGTAEFNAGAGGQISLWPTSLGLAATFDPQLMHRFGEIASEEYRALGIATALSPQVDIATDPRWFRFDGTFGEDPQLATDMARAYCDAFQTTPETKGWGMKSVNAMVKHWYGYGAQEGGRDSHFASGKYAVYPGNNLAMHKRSFVEGAFKLEGGTEMASAVMPIYSILWNQDPLGENVGGSYSKWLIQQQLRDEAGFEGVACTDWGITKDIKVLDSPIGGKPWGMEAFNEAERHYKILQAGVDQFGGNNEIGPVLEAYQMWSKEQGEESARERFELSARRLLLNVFRVGLFENPYLDPAETQKFVGKPEFMQEGYDAQLKSIVMLKNHQNQVLPVKDRKKVYVPKRHFPAIPGIWGGISEEKTVEPIDLALVKKYFDVVEQPEQADFAICLIQEPNTGIGYSNDDVKKGGNGYLPFSLQYDDYTARDARAVSIAGGDPMERFTNRSFRGKTVKAYNRDDMLMVINAKKQMGDKPVIVIIETGRPVVLSEIEPSADAILISFKVQHQALLDIISGKAEPSALLPMQMPADMKTVEEQQEDVPRDMRCYQDADGNTYDFAFGLNWQGPISDARVEKYK